MLKSIFGPILIVLLPDKNSKRSSACWSGGSPLIFTFSCLSFSWSIGYINIKKFPVLVGGGVNIHPLLLPLSVEFAHAYQVLHGEAVEYDIVK